MRVGLDFGTTNSSAAIYDGRHVRLIGLDPVNSSPSIMRSTLFMTREGVPFIGREAINRFTEGNVGREIEYQWRYIGETEVTLAEVGTVMQSLYAVVDANTPGRLFQSLKTHLRDSGFSGTDVFGVRYSLEQLIAVVLRMILQRIETELGHQVTGMVIGRPVHYSLDPEADALAIERMRVACELADLPPFEFLPEPTAAAYAYAAGATSEQRVLVFDFGGGTLDVTVMQVDGRGRSEVLATDGVPIGGDLMDRRIVMGKVLPHFGAGATLGPRKLPLPAVLLDHLSEWQTIVEMTQQRYLNIIDEAIRTGDKPTELKALRRSCARTMASRSTRRSSAPKCASATSARSSSACTCQGSSGRIPSSAGTSSAWSGLTCARSGHVWTALSLRRTSVTRTSTSCCGPAARHASRPTSACSATGSGPKSSRRWTCSPASPRGWPSPPIGPSHRRPKAQKAVIYASWS
jgi:hypothetical chaperone protein